MRACNAACGTACAEIWPSACSQGPRSVSNHDIVCVRSIPCCAFAWSCGCEDAFKRAVVCIMIRKDVKYSYDPHTASKVIYLRTVSDPKLHSFLKNCTSLSFTTSALRPREASMLLRSPMRYVRTCQTVLVLYDRRRTTLTVDHHCGHWNIGKRGART